MKSSLNHDVPDSPLSKNEITKSNSRIEKYYEKQEEKQLKRLTDLAY